MSDLSRRDYVVVILRLVVSHRKELIGGEVVDEEGNFQGRFSGWHGLQRKLQDWLSELDQAHPPDPPEESS